MTKILRIGDLHVKISNLEESQRLIDFAIETVKEHGIQEIEFMGDQFHNHAILRVEVLDFWLNNLKKLSKEGFCVRVLIGNHDLPGSKDKDQNMNALKVFKDIPNVLIIDTPHILIVNSKQVAYIPYMRNKQDFIDAALDLYEKGADKLLITHQTFTGASYDNGFYAPDGIDLELIPQSQIISGHIHKSQQIDKCLYIGTPKWDTMSDANQAKGIWVFEHNEDSSIKSKDFISTHGIAQPIVKIIIFEGELEPELDPNNRNYLEFHGKSKWITKMKKKYKNKAKIKAVPSDRKISNITTHLDEFNLEYYLNNIFEVIGGISKKDILGYLRSFDESIDTN